MNSSLPTGTTSTTAHLDPAHVATITEMLQRGRRISEVIAAGLNVQGGWRRNDAIDVVSARGWKLDSDGRIPARFRSAGQLPTDIMPGAPAPAPGQPVSWPTPGTRQPDPPLRPVPTGAAPPADSVAALLNAGKEHSQARVQKLAEKAEAALVDLRAALGQESEREKLRARLAELNAEQDALRAKLSALGRPPKTRTATNNEPKPAMSTKPIEHGTERGARQHNLRRDPICDACRPFQDIILAKLRAKRGQPA